MFQQAGLVAVCLRFHTRASEPIELDQHAGSAIRGALFGALWGRFCVNKEAPACAVCPLHATCPVATLVAPLRDEAPRGRDVPRPFVIEPPLPAASPSRTTDTSDSLDASGAPEARLRFVAGQPLTFGVTLIGSAAKLLPYVVLATQVMEQQGMGRPLFANRGRRGRFTVEVIEAVDPFSEQAQQLYTRGETLVAAPALRVDAAVVGRRARALPSDRLAMRFLTPMRLVADGQLLHTPHFEPLALRLVERLDALETEYSVAAGAPVETGMTSPDAAAGAPGTTDRHARYLRVGALARGVRLLADETRWEDVASYSARQRRATPIGGLVGRARYEGDVRALRELLVWGEVLHVGKNVVKGDGFYRIEP